MDAKDLRELIRLVRGDPEAPDELRRVLLTDELLHLPQVVALQGGERFERIDQRFERVEGRFDRLEEQIGRLGSAGA